MDIEHGYEVFEGTEPRTNGNLVDCESIINIGQWNRQGRHVHVSRADLCSCCGKQRCCA